MTAVTQHDGKFLAVDGKLIFDGIFTAVTQHDGKLPAADGFRFLGAASKWPNAKLADLVNHVLVQPNEHHALNLTRKHAATQIADKVGERKSSRTFFFTLS